MIVEGVDDPAEASVYEVRRMTSGKGKKRSVTSQHLNALFFFISKII